MLIAESSVTCTVQPTAALLVRRFYECGCSPVWIVSYFSSTFFHRRQTFHGRVFLLFLVSIGHEREAAATAMTHRQRAHLNEIKQGRIYGMGGIILSLFRMYFLSTFGLQLRNCRQFLQGLSKISLGPCPLRPCLERHLILLLKVNLRLRACLAMCLKYGRYTRTAAQRPGPAYVCRAQRTLKLWARRAHFSHQLIKTLQMNIDKQIHAS